MSVGCHLQSVLCSCTRTRVRKRRRPRTHEETRANPPPTGLIVDPTRTKQSLRFVQKNKPLSASGFCGVLVCVGHQGAVCPKGRALILPRC